MATNVIMPALGMAQNTGKLLSWLKREGESVAKGEPIMEVETDKATVEIEAPASGVLGNVQAQAGDEVPVGQAIAQILAAGESPAKQTAKSEPSAINASPIAKKMASEHGIDLAQVRPNGGRVTREDVASFLAQQTTAAATGPTTPLAAQEATSAGVKIPASPKARRLAGERSVDLDDLHGSGPGGAVLAIDVPEPAPVAEPAGVQPLSSTWRVMAERMVASWTSAPHFYLVREVLAVSLIEMRTRITPAVEKRSGVKPTYTDLLIKLTAAALKDHPVVNAGWVEGGIRQNAEINIGMATGIEDGLVVPVFHQADRLSVGEIAALRVDLAARANEHHLRPADLAGGTFTLTNLGMYNVDMFMAVLNPPQAAILAVGRILDRVVAEDGRPVVKPTLVLALSCDHRVIDGVRGAKFLDDLSNLIEEPWGVLA